MYLSIQSTTQSLLQYLTEIDFSTALKWRRRGRDVWTVESTRQCVYLLYNGGSINVINQRTIPSPPPHTHTHHPAGAVTIHAPGFEPLSTELWRQRSSLHQTSREGETLWQSCPLCLNDHFLHYPLHTNQPIKSVHSVDEDIRASVTHTVAERANEKWRKKKRSGVDIFTEQMTSFFTVESFLN